MKKKIDKIFITGVSGFIGGELKLKLKSSGYSVAGLDKNIIDSLNNSETDEFYKADITDKAELDKIFQSKKYDCIIHLAAISNPAAEKKIMHSINVIGTENICSLAKITGAKKIIYISTASVYSSLNDRYITEETIECPNNYYGETKLEAEKIIKSSGLNFTILRPTNIFGLARLDYISYFERVKKSGRKFDFCLYRDRKIHLLYVFDLIDAIIRCISEDRSNNETFIVADSEEYYTEKTLFKILAKIFGVYRIFIPIPTFIDSKKNNCFCDKRIFIEKRIKEKIEWYPQYGVESGLRDIFQK